jgi:hypothetical protein
LALAREHQFEEILAYQAKAFDNHDKKPGGVLSIIQVNPQYFLNAKDLVEKIQADVKSRGWNSAYSRNLVAANIEITGPWSYGDHTGQSYAHVCQIKIENRRKDIAALNVICLLDFVEDPKGNKIYFGDRTPLKWAGLLQAYENTILPGDYGVVDLFAEGMDKPGIFLHSKRDAIPRAPVLKRNGKYKFFYKVYSSQFPVLEFAVDVNYHWLPPLTRKPQSHAIVKLKQKVSGVQQG